MENASKALLIAGAVLIVILLIGVGVMIFNSSQGLFSSATSSMSDQEKTMFNSKFTMYESTQASGTQVREVIRAINTSNANPDNSDVKLNNATVPAAGYDASKIGSDAIVTTARYEIKCTLDANGLVNNVQITKK